MILKNLSQSIEGYPNETTLSSRMIYTPDGIHFWFLRVFLQPRWPQMERRVFTAGMISVFERAKPSRWQQEIGLSLRTFPSAS